MCTHRKGGVKEKILQGIPPTSGIRDSKERGEDGNMIGDATEISVRIEGVGRDGKILQGIPPRSDIRDATEQGGDENMIWDVTEKSVRIGGWVEFPKIKLTLIQALVF